MGLNDLDYIEGQNIVVETRWAEGRPERFPSLAAELVALNLDAIVADSTPRPPVSRGETLGPEARRRQRAGRTHSSSSMTYNTSSAR
jgi:hypothetical protein